MTHPHRLQVTINRKRYVSAIFDITPKEFTRRELDLILGADFKAWVANNRFPDDATWDVKCVKDEVMNYDTA